MIIRNPITKGKIPMLHRPKKAGTQRGHPTQDPVQKMHQHLAWALGAATGARIMNAAVVVAVVGGG